LNRRDGAMTDISLQKTARTARRGQGRPFQKGQSGNPAGRPCGSTNRATRAAELLLDGEATALTRKAVELALAGDPAALRLCLDRTVAPRRDRSVELALPPIHSTADILGAIKVVAGAVGRGDITPGEGFAISQMIESFCGRSMRAILKTGCGNWRKAKQRAVQILMGRPSATVELGFD
jgi:Family of unknown function (DUF5681)